ncbi:MAG: hypothetical protein QM820_29975 [Minicystis sp.]
MSGESVDPELVALLAGLKPAIRVTASPDRAGEVAAKYRARGLKVVEAAEVVSIGGRKVVILYVARAEAHAILVRDAEARVLPGRVVTDTAADREAHREVGRRLGFPRCCVEAFCTRVERGVDRLASGGPGGLAEDYVAAREAWVERPDARVNNLLFAARIKLVSFYPCRYDCAVAIRFAQAVHEAIARVQPGAAHVLLDALAQPIAIAPSNARAMVMLGDDGRIARAEAPRDPAGQVVSPADEAFAASIAGAMVKAGGEIEGASVPPAWLVPFGVTRES